MTGTVAKNLTISPLEPIIPMAPRIPWGPWNNNRQMQQVSAAEEPDKDVNVGQCHLMNTVSDRRPLGSDLPWASLVAFLALSEKREH